MFCQHCGTVMDASETVCTSCGTAVQQAVTYAASAPAAKLPPENEPLSPWAYFGLQLLFSVPVVGFIFLIIFSCKRSNINRRNFALSYWCALLIVGSLIAVVAVLAFLYGFNAPKLR